ncbi:MAG TPA: phenylalanine--tRNA ligase subunit beta [Patescibacteria group bacterium]|nr:phenylalanine--tRNA ligase subunit beta [Patescibacteria group bacterium]
MNIKILDSWLKDYLKTNASAKEIAKEMSLTSVSIERVEPHNSDYVYDIEVTTNRPDLMSVVGLAREAAAVLPQANIQAKFVAPTIKIPEKPLAKTPLTIISDEKNVRRICAAVMEVTVGKSPSEITERLETSDIRSLNNLIDITNYVMRTIGHPTHVFDYDRLPNHTIRIRESKKGETITTLDGKSYTLPGGDIIADEGTNNIIDLISIMGLENSVVNDNTKRIVLFIDNVDPHKIRKTSMQLGIRTEAAQMNEKGIDPERAMDALLFGISLYEKYAKGKLIAPIIDIYPHPYKPKTVSVTLAKIQEVIGVPITLVKSVAILEKLGFAVTTKETTILATVPSFRAEDISIPEDLIEEIARVYGYHNLPNQLPGITSNSIVNFSANPFYWEERAKNALKYWGYTEVYTYPMVSEAMYEGPTSEAVKLANPLGEEFVYMRRTLVPSLLKVLEENRQATTLQIFEIANVYEKDDKSLPRETRMLAGLIRDSRANFFRVKGLLEQLADDFGISNLGVRATKSGLETEIKLGSQVIGTIEILDEDLINFEINFAQLVEHATRTHSLKPLAKYPPIVEDISLVLTEEIPTGDVIAEIKKQSSLVREVTLLDKFENSRTFHILYQHQEKNLTSEEIATLRAKIIQHLKQTFKAKLK